MPVNTDTMFSVTEANRNFSRVTHLMDEAGVAVILKNNRPKYVVVDFEEYDEIQTVRTARRELIGLSLSTAEGEAGYKGILTWISQHTREERTKKASGSAENQLTQMLFIGWEGVFKRNVVCGECRRLRLLFNGRTGR